MTPRYVDVATLKSNDMLASDYRVFLVIKGFNQSAIVRKIIERKGNKAFGLSSLSDITKRRYSKGLIGLASLNAMSLDDSVFECRIESTEPFDVDVFGNLLAYTAGSSFFIGDLITRSPRWYSNDWASYLHTIEFSADGRYILTASTGLDTILEFDLLSGTVVWEWNAWDHGINKVPSSNSHVSRDPDQAKTLESIYPDSEVRLIDNPLKLPREGLPTLHSPMNLNGVHYGPNDQILATGYHRSDLFVIERDGTHQQCDLQLLNPHSFRPFGHGYIVANTGAGVLHLLDESFSIVSTVDFSNLPSDGAKKNGFGEWIQTVSILDAERGLFCAVDALRDGIHLIELSTGHRRFINNPSEWTIQTVVNASHLPTPFRASINSISCWQKYSRE